MWAESGVQPGGAGVEPAQGTCQERESKSSAAPMPDEKLGSQSSRMAESFDVLAFEKRPEGPQGWCLEWMW